MTGGLEGLFDFNSSSRNQTNQTHFEAAWNAAGCWGCFSEVFVHSSLYIAFANQESKHVSFVWLYDPFPYHITLKVTGKTEAQTNRRRVDGFFSHRWGLICPPRGIQDNRGEFEASGLSAFSAAPVAAAGAVLAIAGCWCLLVNGDVIVYLFEECSLWWPL